jgi:hypothetical protein
MSRIRDAVSALRRFCFGAIGTSSRMAEVDN